MPEITVIHIAIIVVTLIAGLLLGWFGRGSQTKKEKNAISAGWREQFEAQRQEHKRLLEQCKSLMDQNSQFQASNKDAKMRASELSDALKETFERRDELQRQIKDIRGNLESAVAERDQLRTDVDSRHTDDESASAQLQHRDAQIQKLNSDLKNWQDRLPPLIERFRVRNAEADALEQQLEAAQEKITALEDMVGSDQTRVEPVDPDALTDGMEASNDPIDDDPDFDAPNAEDIESDGDSTPNARDNLKLIKGVGPAIEKTLNEMGIFLFEQIAAMSEYDIDRVAHRLKGFRSRIYREDWIGQARDLQDQKVSGHA